ncbi:MAG: hypothetical protein M3436_14810 [Pseudomonadota bacterium]|nr:hypothetical protein [Pseudomonadota bacterium]
MNNLKFLFCSLVITSLPVLASHERGEIPVSPLYDPQNHAAEGLNHAEANRIRANAARNAAKMEQHKRAMEQYNREMKRVKEYNRSLGVRPHTPHN